MRSVLLIVGLVVLLSGGVVHGLWTERWHRSPYAQEAAARLDRLPTQFGAWKSVEYEQDAEAIALTGAINHYSRTFTDPSSGDKVLVMLLCGRPTNMVIHRPEQCYQAAGYELIGRPLRVQVTADGQPPAELMTGVFRRDEATGPSQMRIYWSWLSAESGKDELTWSAPGNPRFAFVGQKALYKLYLIRNLTGGTDVKAEDPCARLLGLMLPDLRRTLLDS
jgi:hypothetical protein